MSQIQTELLKIGKVDPTKYDDRQEFLAALCRKIEKMTDAEFDGMTAEAYSWYEQAFQAMNSDGEIPEFPDHEPGDAFFDDAPELTDEQLAGAVVHENGVPVKKKKSRTGVARYDAVTGEKDKWGVTKGTKTSDAMAMFEAGAFMAEVTEKLGGKYYNALKDIEKDGHRVEKLGNGKTKITHKDEA